MFTLTLTVLGISLVVGGCSPRWYRMGFDRPSASARAQLTSLELTRHRVSGYGPQCSSADDGALSGGLRRDRRLANTYHLHLFRTLLWTEFDWFRVLYGASESTLTCFDRLPLVGQTCIRRNAFDHQLEQNTQPQKQTQERTDTANGENSDSKSKLTSRIPVPNAHNVPVVRPKKKNQKIKNQKQYVEKCLQTSIRTCKAGASTMDPQPVVSESRPRSSGPSR